ncbi:hypothetical protein Hdeb2414_s0023g00629141 [Helianthus debilis subsp. tardiflorus]
MLIRGLPEFKELFGSFTSHRSENGTTGKRHGSTGSKECEKQKTQHLGTVADGSHI